MGGLFPVCSSRRTHLLIGSDIGALDGGAFGASPAFYLHTCKGGPWRDYVRCVPLQPTHLLIGAYNLHTIGLWDHLAVVYGLGG